MTMVIMTMAVSMAVSMTMSMAMSMTVSMTVIESKDTDQVDNETYKTDKQQTISVHLRGMHQTLKCLNYDGTGDQHQEDTVEESSHCFNTIVPNDR